MNTTFTTYAEKKAKQFLNLLQGYTKGIRMTAILILLLMGVSNAWGATITSDGTARLYFNMKAISWWNAGSNGDGNFAYFFNNSTSQNAWSAHSVQYSGDTYYIVIPNGTWESVILTRNNTKTDPQWNVNVWNQTGDITLSSTSNYLSKFKSGSDGEDPTWGDAVKPASTGSLSASSASVNIGDNVTLTPSLTSNTDINVIKSTSYSISPSSGASISGNTFTATAAGTYTVTATITYNAKGFVDITSTATASATITVQNTEPTVKITSCPTNIRQEDQLNLTIEYSNIPENVTLYRVKATTATGTTYYQHETNGEWINLPASNNGTINYCSRANHFLLGDNTIVVEFHNGNRQLQYESDEKVVKIEQKLDIAVYRRVENSGDTHLGNIHTYETFGTDIDGATGNNWDGVGYAFDGWVAIPNDKIHFTNAQSPQTQVTATQGGQVFAVYKKETCVYFINAGEWSSVKVYAWNGSGETKNAAWPGVAMTKTNEKIKGYDVYKYTPANDATYEKLIFVDGSNDNNKTGDNLWVSGKYYYPVFMHSNIFKQDWSSSECFDLSQDESYASLTLNINKGDNYEFGMKVPDWKADGTSFTRQNNTKLLGNNSSNMKFNADVTGEYTFTWTFATNTLTITYPTLSSYTVNFDMKGHGEAPESQTIEQGGKVTKPADPEADGFTFGGWYTDAECTTPYDFNTTVSSSFTLYAKWIQQYVIVGNGNGSWLSGHSWIGDGTVTTDNNNIIQWSKTYKACPAGLKNFRIVPWGVNSWGQEHGFYQIDREESSKIPYYTNEDNNIAFVTVAKADITIRFDVANNKITIEVNYNCEGADLETVKSSVVTGENVMFYFGDEIIAEEQRKTDYKYVNDYELVNGVINHRVTEAKGFRLQGVGNDKWLAVAILPPNIYRISNNPTWDGVSTDETVQAGAIYAWYGEKVKRKIDGVTPTWNNLTVSVKVGTNASGLSAEVGNSSVNRAQTITDYYHQKEGESTWTKFDPTDVSKLSVGIYKVHALAYDGNIYVRTAEAATLTIYDEYTINYNDQGGIAFSGAHEDGYPAIHLYGQTTELKSATKTGYTFDGWFTSPDCIGEPITTLGATNYTAAITLYAKWTAIRYTVELDQTGAQTQGITSVTATYDAAMPAIGQLPTAKDGYEFAGYYDQKDGAGTQYYNAEGASVNAWDKADNSRLYAK